MNRLVTAVAYKPEAPAKVRGVLRWRLQACMASEGSRRPSLALQACMAREPTGILKNDHAKSDR